MPDCHRCRPQTRRDAPQAPPTSRTTGGFRKGGPAPPCAGPPLREQKGGGDAARRNGLRPSEWVRLPCPPGVAPRPEGMRRRRPQCLGQGGGFRKGGACSPLAFPPPQGGRGNCLAAPGNGKESAVSINTMVDGLANPLAEGLSEYRAADPALMVIFGATGDLSGRKLLPALYNLARNRLLPAGFALIGAAKEPLDDERFRALAADRIRDHSRTQPIDE